MKNEVTVITDDITGEEGATTRTFQLDNVTYTIDLADESYSDLLDALAPFIAKAQRTKTKPKYRGPHGVGSSGGSFPDLSRVRVWAAKQGIHVGVRGRIPKTVLAAYEQAQVS